MKLFFLYILMFLCSIHFIFSQTPINDSVKNAFLITNLNNWCSDPNAFTNVGATPDLINNPSCWTSGRSHDVWFLFYATAPAVNISINGQGTGLGSLLYPQVALYLFKNSNSFSEIQCVEATSAEPGYTNLFQSGLLIGQAYLIRVDALNNNIGTFQFCVNNYIPLARSGQDCNTAVFLCNKNTISQNALNGYGNIIEGYETCLAGGGGTTQPEKNSIWYYWEAANDGPLTFTIYPNMPNDDIDFVIYELINGCSNKIPIRCEASQCRDANNRIIGPTGINMTSTDTIENFNCANGQDNFVKYLDMKQGKVYALLINNFTDDNVGTDNGFTIQFGGSGEFVGVNVQASPDQTICLGKSVQLDASLIRGTPPYTFQWGPSQTLSDTAIRNPVATPLTTTKYVVMVTDSIGCSANSSVTINVTSPTIDFNANIVEGCPPLKVTFSPIPNTNISSCLWEFSDGDTIISMNPTHKFINSGYYDVKLTITDIQGCMAINQKTNYIEVYDSAEIDFKVSEISKCPPPFTISLLPVTTDSIISVLWDFNDGNSSNQIKPSYKFNSIEAFYNVKITFTNSNGCEASKLKKIDMPLCDILIPNIFSPNNDGQNDFFKVTGIVTGNWSMQIYNRWGKLVFETNNPKEEHWDGITINGNKASDGVYFYLLKNHSLSKEYKGFLHLIH